MVKIDPSSRSHFNHGVEKKKKAKTPIEKQTAKAREKRFAHPSKSEAVIGGKPLVMRAKKQPTLGSSAKIGYFAKIMFAATNLRGRISGILTNPTMAKLVRAAFANKHKKATTIRSAIKMTASPRAMQFAKTIKS